MTQEDANIIVDFTNALLKSSRLRLTAEAETLAEGFKVQVRGDDVAILLGHNAEFLDALEYLGNRVLSKGRDEETHIAFDSGNYRARREKELHMMAEKAAEKVRTTKIPFKFDPMSAHERKIIHLALSIHTGIRTESTGNGEDRRLVVYPA
ncbi:MAG: R3H domain-containing nucleic acid-binding protein [Acidobacteriota bacterium]